MALPPRRARFAVFPVGHFVMLFRVPTSFCKWLYFQYADGFGGEKSPLPAFCFQDVDGFGDLVENGRNVAIEFGGFEAGKAAS
jgi:hypothetical protein